ncbi:MAG: hypothetical protein A4E44_00957 [Methanosaeta sp. PtaB.Bin018]|nr:MAG: hypothetical protein A4E44_00957 [Methanosaeta sp. PtaB.Bin018]OPY43847.1 MAG: hypothetical protein A4E46_01643 [Methanosaeta sp. PtaU1.Bin016]
MEPPLIGAVSVERWKNAPFQPRAYKAKTFGTAHNTAAMKKP